MRSLISRYRKQALTALVAISVCALLFATLWPLTPYPRNEVRWLGYEDGVVFGDYATMFSAREFPRDSAQADQDFSLEFWMRPARSKDSNVILAFYTPASPWQFTVRQDESDLNVLHAGPQGVKSLLAGEVMARGRDLLVTLTAGSEGTTIYIDGKARKFSSDFGLGRADLCGEMVVGNSPMGNNSWGGVLRGIAIYSRSLSAGEVAEHYAAWSGNRSDTLNRGDMLAFYRFRERAGATVKDEVPGGIDLNIPGHYSIWRQALLTPAWKEFEATAAYARDLAENVAGFVPLGLVLYPYFLVVRKAKRPWLMSYLSGALLSLTIEILQAFIPARYSGWTDVITNSSGTALGASVYLGSGMQRFLTNLFADTEVKKAA
ncbi:MAG TPA: VanZ family protein [Candidatus Acidoferrum sp.]|nr:VanZ family protein [Candidatus Acidoferrum sp.]